MFFYLQKLDARLHQLSRMRMQHLETLVPKKEQGQSLNVFQVKYFAIYLTMTNIPHIFTIKYQYIISLFIEIHDVKLQVFTSKIQWTEKGYLFVREANGVAQTGQNAFVCIKYKNSKYSDDPTVYPIKFGRIHGILVDLINDLFFKLLIPLEISSTQSLKSFNPFQWIPAKRSHHPSTGD